MAKFIFKEIKHGYENKLYDISVALVGIESVEENEEVITIPSTYEGKEVLLLGYDQEVIPAHEHFHDYHHPSQGSEWRDTYYSFTSTRLIFPSFVKKVIVPKCIKDISYYAFEKANHVKVEFEEGSKFYVNEGKIYKGNVGSGYKIGTYEYKPNN